MALDSRVDGGAGGPVDVCDDGKELREWRNPLCLAPRRKHIMCEMEFVVLPIVRSKEGIRVTPRTLYSISVIPVSGLTIENE